MPPQKTFKKYQCMAPFMQLMMDTKGNHSPCAVLDGIWHKKNDVWNHEALEKLRDNHAKGIRDDTCESCWVNEETGIESYRQRYHASNKFNKEAVLQSIEDGSYKDGPTSLYLKNGNICNLQCRICGPKDSFSWAPEANALAKKYNTQGTYMEKGVQKNNWTAEQLKSMLYWNKKLNRVDLFGGEALTNTKVLDYLQLLVDEGVSKDITVYFNTNATRTPTESWWNVMKQFKALEFELSLDGVEEQFEYQRYPAKWTDVISFRKWIFEKSKLMPITYGIIVTVNSLNIWYLPETLAKLIAYKKIEVYKNYPQYLTDSRIFKRILDTDDAIFFNHVSYPAHYNIQNMPASIKRQVDYKLSNSKYADQFEEIKRYMWLAQDDPEDWQKFLQWTGRHDVYRKQKFSDAFTEFNDVICNTSTVLG